MIFRSPYWSYCYMNYYYFRNKDYSRKWKFRNTWSRKKDYCTVTSWPYVHWFYRMMETLRLYWRPQPMNYAIQHNSRYRSFLYWTCGNFLLDFSLILLYNIRRKWGEGWKSKKYCHEYSHRHTDTPCDVYFPQWYPNTYYPFHIITLWK